LSCNYSAVMQPIIPPVPVQILIFFVANTPMSPIGESSACFRSSQKFEYHETIRDCIYVFKRRHR
jgi:hypothetical protein